VSHTLASDTNDLAVLHPLLRRLGDRLAARLRRLGLAARRLTIAIRYADYTEGRTRVALAAESLDVEVWRALRRGFATAHQKRIAVREIAVTAGQLFDADRQLDLWDRPDPDVDREAILQRAVDTITTRWGRRGIERAPSLAFPLQPVTTRAQPFRRSRSGPSGRAPRPTVASGAPSR
jgi:DNA polymerase-4